MDEREVLLRAADLIESKGWCKDFSALDADLNEVDPWSDSACVFCAVGAIESVAANGYADFDGLTLSNGAIDRLSRALGARNVIRWNDEDGRTQEEVVAALRKAAEGL